MGMYLLSKLVGGFDNLLKLFKKLTGRKAKDSYRTSNASSAYGSSNSGTSSAASGGTGARRAKENGDKMFGSNEGTYVDFEEVK